MREVRSKKSSFGTHLQSLAACLRGAPADDTNWDEVIRLANDHLIGPRLHRSIAASVHATPTDREAMDYLASLDAANRERNLRLSDQLAELVQSLLAEGIEPIVLKGAAELVRGAPHAVPSRMMRDLDILVRPDEAARADMVMRACGYSSFQEDPGFHTAANYFRPTDVGAVDVHVRLPRLFAHLLSPGELRARTGALPLGGVMVRVPDRSLQFVINLGHEMLHDEAVVSGFIQLRYLIELLDLAGNAQTPLDWPWILGKCDCWKFRLGLALQARMARHLGFDGFPGPRETSLIEALHRRRLFKMAHPRLAEAEWQVVRQLKRLRHLREPRPEQPASAFSL